MGQQVPSFDVMAYGRWGAERLCVDLDPSERATTPELEKAIEEEWERRVAEARRVGGLLFNGGMYRYVRHAVRGAEFHLTVGPTCYRDFVGTNLYNHHRVSEIGWERFSNPVGTTATLTTSDGRIVYGRRSDKVAYHASHVHTFGGAIEACDRDGSGRVDVFGGVQRELHEELGLRPEEYEPLACVGLVRDREILQPEMLFESRVRMTFDELVERWRGAEAKNEHVELVWLANEAEAVEPFLRSCGLIAPVAIAAVLLHGRSRWGEAWYADLQSRW